MVVVSAYRNHRGKNPMIIDMLKRLMEWQLEHNCRIDIVYVPSKVNKADGPSRFFDYADEICVR